MELALQQEKAKHLRADILKMLCCAKSGHPGGSLSCLEILMALYYNVMKVDPAAPHWEERDRFVLSKGHACPALYAVLADKGFFPREELWTLRKTASHLQGHPDMRRAFPLRAALPWLQNIKGKTTACSPLWVTEKCRRALCGRLR